MCYLMPETSILVCRGDTVFADFYVRLESLRDFFATQPDRQARMQQFFAALGVRTFKS